MQRVQDNGDLIEASPTKEFFISMLVKDIDLPEAITDLVDNSVDGARRVRVDEDYRGLRIRLEADVDRFLIEDNCGGIDTTTARTYAFRFGRPEGMQDLRRSVGQFGVGMKRALFKLGTRFRIESTTVNSRFVVDVNVEEWKQTDDWHFTFDSVDEGLTFPLEDTGTKIVVTNLHASVREDFQRDNFQTRLADRIRDAHETSMERGLVITHNGMPLDVRPLRLLQSNDLAPAYRVEELTFGEQTVTVRIFAGISEGSPADAGWYVFCNGRQVLRADQTAITGWGDGLPKYHPQYSRFRGYVFFDADDATLLPWRTTKTGVDMDSRIYRGVREQMIMLAQPVFAFLNKVDRETTEDDKPLTRLVEQATPTALQQIAEAPRFREPALPPRPRTPPGRRIAYTKPPDQVQAAMNVLQTDVLREIGEQTFDYFYARECE